MRIITKSGVLVGSLLVFSAMILLAISTSATSSPSPEKKSVNLQGQKASQKLVTRSLRVSRYYSTSLSNSRADRYLRDATDVIQVNDGWGDLSCNLTLRRSGGVRTFYTGDGSIDTERELNNVLSNRGVNIVNRINYCGGYAPNIIGCAYIGSSSFVAVRYSSSLDGILWLHEYGHTRGLYHRNSSTAVMNPTIASNRRRVTSNECYYFQG